MVLCHAPLRSLSHIQQYQVSCVCTCIPVTHTIITLSSLSSLVILFIIIFKAPLVNDLSLRERSVREPATTGMHRNIGVGIDPHGGFRTGTSHRGNAWEYLGGNWPPRGFPYGNQPPRQCTGIFGWEPATTGMHGNVGWEHPYSDVQCVLSCSSACHTKDTKPPSKLVVQLFKCLKDYSRKLAAVKNQKAKADEIVTGLRLEKPITWSLLDRRPHAPHSSARRRLLDYRRQRTPRMHIDITLVCVYSSLHVLFRVVLRVLHVSASGQRAYATRKKRSSFRLK